MHHLYFLYKVVNITAERSCSEGKYCDKSFWKLRYTEIRLPETKYLHIYNLNHSIWLRFYNFKSLTELFSCELLNRVVFKLKFIPSCLFCSCFFCIKSFFWQKVSVASTGKVSEWGTGQGAVGRQKASTEIKNIL